MIILKNTIDMKTVLLLLFLMSSTVTLAQGADAFDFWLGEWNCFWVNPKGDTVVGHNSISKILDQTVIQEKFEDTSRNFKGISVSVYNTRTNTWNQAWADNQGGYYSFIGIVDDSLKIFSTDTSKLIIERMKFHNLKADSFTWDWEKSKDGGITYQLSWRIFYRKKTD